MTASIATRFWSKVVKTKTCWLWKGNTNQDGYGQALRPGGILRVPAHRLSWELHSGEIPAGARVLHTCHVRNCVNPAHLFLGKQRDRSRIGMRVIKEHP